MNKLTAKQIAEKVSPTDPLLRLAELLVRINRRENVIKDEDDDDNGDTTNTNKTD